MRSSSFLLALSLYAFGCSDDTGAAHDVTFMIDATEAARANADLELEIETVLDGDSETDMRSVQPADFPLCVTVEAESDATVELRLRLHSAGSLVGETAATLTEPTTGLLALTLEADCDLSDCDTASACGVGGCTAPIAWTGADLGDPAGARCMGSDPTGDMGMSTEDMGPGDGGMCEPTGSETCNGVDDDCNGTVDDGDATTECPDGAHATGECTGGACAFACGDGWGDCNDEDGCETDLKTTTDCGACGNSCADGESCVEGACFGPSLLWGQNVLSADFPTRGATTPTGRGWYFARHQVAEAPWDTPTPTGQGPVLGSLAAADGAPEEVTLVDSAGDDVGQFLASVGETACVGAAVGTSELGFGGETYPASSNTRFVGCLGADGSAEWGARYDVDQLNGLAGNDSTLFVAARTSDTRPSGLGSATTHDRVIAALDPGTGAVEWQEGFSRGDFDDFDLRVVGLAANADRVCATIMVDPTAPTTTFTYEGETFGGGDIESLLVTCLAASDGSHLWSQEITSGDGLSLETMAVTDDGGVVLAGSYDDDLTVDGTSASCGGDLCFSDPFWIRLAASDGGADWVRDLTAPGILFSEGISHLAMSDGLLYSSSVSVFPSHAGFIEDDVMVVAAHDPLNGAVLWSAGVDGSATSSSILASVAIAGGHGRLMLIANELDGEILVGGRGTGVTHDGVRQAILMFDVTRP